MSLIHRIFRYTIYAICLIISTSLIMYFLWNLSNNRIYHYGVPVGVIAIESLAQYFLSLGKGKVKAKRYLQGIFLISIYAFYVLLFGVLSAIGFFAAEISSNIAATTKAQQIDSIDQKRIKQIDDLIASLNLQMTTEAKTGFGRNSQAILAEIKRLKAEQTALIDQMNKESKQDIAGPVDAFSALAKMFRFDANTLAIIIFGSLCLFVYTGLTVCNPNLELDETEDDTEGGINGTYETDTKNNLSLIRSNETDGRTIPENNVTDETKNETEEKSKCLFCGTEFPKGDGRRLYCNDKCRKAAFRQREALGA